MPTSKYIPTAREKYITLTRLDHYGCIATPLYTVGENMLKVRMVKCSHLKENRKIVISREDI